FERFKPVCKTADLGSCSRQDIVNAYDNSIGYTDHFLNQAIHTLRGLQDYDTAMIYVSDQSLGEKGLYLHGVPYAIAPKEQTHVPMVMWFSPEFARDRGLDETCLRHVKTSVYARERDLFAQCAG
ncbi:sulfatase-like hydrolase/transferase, partial [Xanthomonas hortorum]|uniref:sulfatase-like hydrolase/transferase n=1 Tax=Xanthomonas hortorum TaxID=56454 RepID=UPI0001FD5CD7